MAEDKKVDARLVDVAALEQEAAKANEALQRDGHIDPFDGDSVSIEVTKQINTAQFQDEIEKRAKRTVQVSLSLDDPTQIASKSKPGTLFVSPKSIGDRVLREAYEAHTADDGALPQPEPAAPSAPTLSKDAQDLLDKVKGGKALTAQELTVVVASLAGVSTGD